MQYTVVIRHIQITQEISKKLWILYFTLISKKTNHLYFYSLKVISLLEMPSLEDLTKETALPSSVFPSDHLRIEAIFECKGNKDN